MVSKVNVSLQLSTFLLNGHDIRYLSLSDNCYVCSTDFVKMSKVKAIPLFLATDILNGIEQDKKNFYRIHSRFAKDGLATKLTFKDAVLVGINNSSGIWFYSVQGLFQAVFEYHNRKTQRLCMVELLNLWLARYDDKLASAVSVEVKMTDELADIETSSAIQSDINITATNLHSADSVLNTNSELQSTTNDFSKSDLKSVAANCKSETTVNLSSKISLPCADILIRAKDEQLLKGDKPNIINISGYNSMKDLLNSFLQALKTEHERFPRTTCIDPSQMETVCCVLEVLTDELNESSQGFPFDLIARYQAEVEKHSPPFNKKNNFDILWNRDIALCVISDWLGENFNQLEPEIALKVEKFKSDHIECIDSLPQAEAMIDMLFPSCMKCLLCSWIGIREDSAEPSLFVDHDYGNRSKRCKRSYQTSRNLFPLIQIILEFTNNALISGVAHVVFTRLMLTT
ncbi:uncharacterized protein LOC121389257 [Gigantopelta aegis]|uniref:uncharacterized protein LOC121389257 n=1 Tax=Gigantopelta aegis TaxID=1735272 RepID=UPI001B88A66E|nr:uncharacterized protein LOC121389257 [Gigantopelta aegis]